LLVQQRIPKTVVKPGNVHVTNPDTLHWTWPLRAGA